MGTEFLVACLWGVVLVYWFWSRLPATSDTVGVFRRELRVLEHATPARVAPANRRCAADVPSLPTSLVAAALCHKRMAAPPPAARHLSVLARRGRGDLRSCSLATRSGIALAAQRCLTSPWLLRIPPGQGGAGERRIGLVRRNADGRPPVGRSSGAGDRSRLAGGIRRLVGYRRAGSAAGPRPEPASAVATSSRLTLEASRPAGCNQCADTGYADRTYASESYGDESYGDFDSYASLALASAR